MRRILAFLVLSAAAACARERAPIFIATAGPWTESYGIMNKRGIELAVEEINALGGLHGRQLQTVSRDDESSGSKAAAIAGEFVSRPEIVAVVGHVTSGAMVAAARVYDQGLPAVATSASSPDLSGISPWVFRVISSDSANGVDMARFVRRLGFRRAAVLYENSAYGRGLTDAFRRGFDGEFVTIDPIPSAADASFEPYVAYLRTRKPDIVFVAGTEGSGLGVLREARRQGLHSAFAGGDGWSSVVSDTAASEGAYVGAPFAANDSREEVQRFVKAFRSKYGVEPDGFAALAYDATRLVARAIEKGGPSRVAVRDWLASLGPESAFAGVTGSISFLPSGDVAGKGVVMTQVRRGQLVVSRATGRT